MKHIWELDESGYVASLDFGDFHDGPRCVLCGESFCRNCEPGCHEEKCDFLEDWGALSPAEVNEAINDWRKATTRLQDTIELLRTERQKLREAARNREQLITMQRALVRSADARAATDRSSAAALAAQYQEGQARWARHLAEHHPYDEESS